MGLNVKCETVDRIGNYENSAEFHRIAIESVYAQQRRLTQFQMLVALSSTLRVLSSEVALCVLDHCYGPNSAS